jgi:hypothetical protein
MANKNTTTANRTAEALANAGLETNSKLSTTASSENQNSNNPRYSLGGARASLGPVKAGRLSNAAEFGDAQGKLSISGRQSLSTVEGRVSLSR